MIPAHRTETPAGISVAQRASNVDFPEDWTREKETRRREEEEREKLFALPAQRSKRRDKWSECARRTLTGEKQCDTPVTQCVRA